MEKIEYSMETHGEVVEKAAGVVKQNGVLLYPTDTVYGLGANALDKKAVEKVFKAKKRSGKKPVSVMVSDLSMLSKYAVFSPAQKKVLKKLLPGPFTLIMEAKEGFPDLVKGPYGKVAFRIPKKRIALDVCKKAGVPMTCTSANLSGKQTPADVETILGQLGEEVDLAIDAGPLESEPSTILDLVGKEIVLVREGVVKKAALRMVLGL